MVKLIQGAESNSFIGTAECVQQAAHQPFLAPAKNVKNNIPEWKLSLFAFLQNPATPGRK